MWKLEAMKRFVKPMTQLPSNPDEAQALPQNSADFDLTELLSKSGEILRREISNLMMESSRGKLSSQSAKDLVNYISVLSTMKNEQEKMLAELSDDELKELSQSTSDQPSHRTQELGKKTQE